MIFKKICVLCLHLQGEGRFLVNSAHKFCTHFPSRLNESEGQKNGVSDSETCKYDFPSNTEHSISFGLE